MSYSEMISALNSSEKKQVLLTKYNMAPEDFQKKVVSILAENANMDSVADCRVV